MFEITRLTIHEYDSHDATITMTLSAVAGTAGRITDIMLTTKSRAWRPTPGSLWMLYVPPVRLELTLDGF